MDPRAFVAGDPATRVADEQDVLEHVAWPRGFAEAPAARRARAAEGLARLVRLGLPVREDPTGRRFDPYEVFFFMRWAHRRFGDPLWGEALEVARGYVAEHLPATDAATGFEVRFEREVHLGARPPGARWRVHLPLPSADEVQRAVAITPSAPAGTRLQQDHAVLDVRGTVPAEGSPVSRFGATIWLRAGWSGARIDPARVEPLRAFGPDALPFLSTKEGPIQVTSRLRDLARDLAGEARTPWEALRAFWRFLFSRLVLGRIHPHTLSAADPLGSLLETGRADCYHAAALLAALCRARGIPARLVSGYFLYPRCSTNHSWAEVLVPPYGWVPCDLWSWTLADGDVDCEWGELLLGRVEPRLVIERLPRTRLILDQPGSRWTYELQRPCAQGDGIEILVRDLRSNELLRRDRVLTLRRASDDAACTAK